MFYFFIFILNYSLLIDNLKATGTDLDITNQKDFHYSVELEEQKDKSNISSEYQYIDKKTFEEYIKTKNINLSSNEVNLNKTDTKIDSEDLKNNSTSQILKSGIDLKGDDEPSIFSKIKSIFDFDEDISKMSGAYRSVKLMVTFPYSFNFGGMETQLLNSRGDTIDYNIFQGSGSLRIMPSFAFAVGYAFPSYYSFEVELQYLPINSKLNSISSLYGHNFKISGQAISVDIMMLSLNNYLRGCFFSGKLSVFFGLGIGIGYGFSKDSYFLSSNLILPTFNATLGVGFGIGQNTVINIFWRTTFIPTIEMYNKTAFEDTTNAFVNLRPIQSGKMKMSNVLINAIGIELLFYSV